VGASCFVPGYWAGWARVGVKDATLTPPGEGVEERTSIVHWGQKKPLLVIFVFIERSGAMAEI